MTRIDRLASYSGQGVHTQAGPGAARRQEISGGHGIRSIMINVTWLLSREGHQRALILVTVGEIGVWEMGDKV